MDASHRDHWVERSRSREEDGWGDGDARERKRRTEYDRTDRSLRRRTDTGEHDHPRHRYDDYEQDFHDAPTDPEEVCMKAEMPVRRDLAGAVIGRGGETVSRIRRTTGAHVHICEPLPGESERIVELIGTKAQVAAACSEVRDVMIKEAEDWTVDHGHITKATIQLQIAPEMVGCLIGKGGGNVKNIKNCTGAVVKVDSLREGETTQAVHIYGDPDAILQAHQMVMDTLRGFDQRKSRLGKATGSTAPAHPGEQQQLEPGEIVPAGATIPTGQNASVVVPRAGGSQGVLNVAGLGALSADGAQILQQMPGNAAMPSAAQTAFVIQTPQGGSTPPPTILVLQPDGTYHPAPVIFQTLPQAQVAGMQQTTLQQASGQQPNVASVSAGPQLPTTNLPANMVTAASLPMQTNVANPTTGTLPVQQTPNIQQLSALPQLTNSTQLAGFRTGIVGDAVTAPIQTSLPVEALNVPLQGTKLGTGLVGGLSGNGTNPMLVLGQDGTPQAVQSGLTVAALQGLQTIQLAPGGMNMGISIPTETAQQVQNITSDEVTQ